MFRKRGFKEWHSLMTGLPQVLIRKLPTLAAPPRLLIKRRYVRFQRLLKNYGKVLELLADASEKQGGGFVLDKQYIVALTNRLGDLAESIVYDLNVLTDQQYLDFYNPLDRFKKETKEIIEGLEYEDEPEYQMFLSIQDKIARLTLGDRAEHEFGIYYCQTLHDVVHLAYENAVKSLTGGELHREGLSRISKKLESKGHVIFQVIDIGDGLKPEKASELVIAFEDIQSRPMIALGEAWCNQETKSAPDSRQRRETDPLSLFDALPFHGRNVAVISREYLNLILHRGSDVDMIDSYLCEEPELNHILCRFSKEKDRQHLSLLLTNEVLQRLDFEVEQTTKAVNAWISTLSLSAMEECLRIIGRLTIFIRRLEEGRYSTLSPETVTSFFFQNGPKTGIFKEDPLKDLSLKG